MVPLNTYKRKDVSLINNEAIKTGFHCISLLFKKVIGDGRLFDLLAWRWALIRGTALIRGNTVFDQGYH